VLASETGVLPIDPANVLEKGRLQPGKMFLVDTAQKRIIPDDEIRASFVKRQPYRQWLKEQQVRLEDLPRHEAQPFDFKSLLTRQQAFGYTLEDLRILLTPMATNGEEPIGSMGNDTPLAILSQRPQLLYNYFKQLFAQVTNPPLDAIREEIVTSMVTTLGAEQDLFQETAAHCHQLRLRQPILTNADLESIRASSTGKIRAHTISTVYEVAGGVKSLQTALDRIRREAHEAVLRGRRW